MNEKKVIEDNKNDFEFFTEISKKQNIIIPELTFKNIQTEMLLFKNEILKDINQLTKDIREKHQKYDFTFKDEMKKINNLLKNTENKIKDLSDLVSIDKETKRKLEILLEFKTKVEDYMMINDIKMANLDKDISDNIYRHDSIFKDTVIYPGIIGPMCRFKNFHDLIDYFINQIFALLKYKEKNEIDLAIYKNKLETMISGFKLQIDNFMKSSTQFTRKTVNQTEERINTLFLKYDDIINVNRLQCCKSNIDLEENINNYKKLNEENIKNIIDENDKLNNKLRMQKDDIRSIQDKINEIKKSKEYNSNYYNNRFNKNSYRNMKLVKSASNAYEKEDKNKNKGDKKENNQKENNEEKKTNTNDVIDSKTTIQINNDIKSLEMKLENFIKSEIVALTKNINNSIQKINLEKQKEKEEMEKKLKSINLNKEELSKESDNHLIIKTDIEREKNIISQKRNSYIPNNLPQNLFEQFIKKREEKIIFYKKRNKLIFEKIKEVFIEESFQKPDKTKKKRKIEIKKRNSKINIPQITKIIPEAVVKKEMADKKVSNSTKILPFIETCIKKRKEKELKKNKNLENKKIMKKPLKNKSFKNTQTSSLINKKNLTQKMIKPKITLNYIDHNINNNILEFQIRPYSKTKFNALTIEPKNPKNTIEFKEDLIKTPKITRNQHLSNFTITLQGAKKFSLDQADKTSNENINLHKANLHSPTIYMNFPRAHFQFNERLMESLHPLYRNKKFSKYIRPYISALTNNYQTMMSHNEKKVMSQKKVTLNNNKSDTNIIKKKVLKMANEKEIKLPDIIDEEIGKNLKHYSPGLKDKVKTLEEKEIFSFSSNKNNIQDIYLNKDNRFNILNVKGETRFINLKKKI